jgi:hypothetical protein
MAKVKTREQVLENSRLAIKKWAGKTDDEWLIDHLDKLADEIQEGVLSDVAAIADGIEFGKVKSFTAIEKKYGKKNKRPS